MESRLNSCKGSGDDDEAKEREASKMRLLQYQERMAASNSLGPPVPDTFLHHRRGPRGEQPLFSFGIITDIQYADIEDGQSFLGIPRFYRHSLEVTQQAVTEWNSAGGVSFAIHFGDLVDGFCPKEKSMRAFQQVLSELNRFATGPVYHMLGNHCLYNLPRPQLNQVLAIPTPEAESGEDGSYYHFSPYPSFRFVVLDAYDISELGWPTAHPKAQEAKRILQERNPNSDKNSPHGLRGPARRFVKYNGGVGPVQLAWLQGVLRNADADKERVVVCSHLPLDPSGLPTPTCLLWNFEEVLGVLKASESVVAVLSGHAHFGAYSQDDAGIHHRVLEAVLECPPGRNAYGRVDVYDDRMCLIGRDRMLSTNMIFGPRTLPSAL